MPEVLGVHLGDAGVALTLVESARTGVSVRAFHESYYPEGVTDTAGKAAFAAAFAGRLGYGRISLALALPATDVLLRPVTVPFVKPSHIAKTLKFEMEDQLLFDVETAAMDFVVTGSPDAHTSQLLVAAIPRETLDAACRPFEEAGFRLRLATADVLTAAALASVLGAGDLTVIDLGSSAWRLGRVSGGKLDFARATPAAAIDGGLEGAVAAWYRQGLAAARDVEVEKVVVTGWGSSALDLESLGRALGIPAQPASLTRGSIGAEEAEGLAMKGLGAFAVAAQYCLKTEGFDFYSASRGGRTILDAVAAPLCVGLVILTALLAISGLASRREYAAARQGIVALQEAETALWNSAFSGREVPPAGILDGMKQSLAALRDESPQDVVGRKARILKALHVIAVSVPEGQAPTFSGFEAVDERGALEVRVKASAPDSSAADILARSITDEGTFRAESRNVQKKPGSDEWSFEIVMSPTR